MFTSGAVAEAGRPISIPRPWVTVSYVVGVAFGFPLAVLAIGGAFVWAFAGFTRPKPEAWAESFPEANARFLIPRSRSMGEVMLTGNLLLRLDSFEHGYQYRRWLLFPHFTPYIRQMSAIDGINVFTGLPYDKLVYLPNYLPQR